MTEIIGVRFRKGGKIYYFGPKGYDIHVGDHVIVETARGVEYGYVVMGPKVVEDSDVVQPLKDVLRPADQEDEEKEQENREKEKKALKEQEQELIQ